MQAHTETVRTAYTYAWWLTGEDHAAARALAAARVMAGDDPQTALAAVRRNAISERTMCPASEVALLHDQQGLPLPEAARLAEVDPEDARTELAHGRLEALTEAPDGPFRHPERLGGLAVGNPADVAHARQCEDCGRARDHLDEGRAALRALPEITLPDDLTPRERRRSHPALLVAAGILFVAVVLMLLASLAGGGAPPDQAAGQPSQAVVEPATGAAAADPATAWDDARGWLAPMTLDPEA